MSDLLFFGDGQDQSLPIDARTEQETYLEVDKILERSIQEKNVYIALNAVRSVFIRAQLTGYTLAKYLYEIKANWDKFEIEDSFEDIVYDYIGRGRTTIDRYISVWNLKVSGVIPYEYQDELFKTNIRDVIPIAKAVEQGYDFDYADWENLAIAVSEGNNNEVLRIVREDVKGKEPRKGSLQIYLESDGTLMAWKDDIGSFVGSLDIHSSDEVAQKAIDRIISGTGVLKR